MDRLISEKEVLKAFEKYLRFEGNFHEMIKAIQPAESIAGHWIEGGYDDYKWVCSECGYPRYEYYEKPKAKYCECCGCPMEIEPQEREDKE